MHGGTEATQQKKRGSADLFRHWRGWQNRLSRISFDQLLHIAKMEKKGVGWRDRCFA